ncbi:hypothetical protein Y032_0040g306 [Ancylostoma ceylanicum]|uniref:Uncharacterized protein n=1 Tax=Ancylostoma ceylanicum TaxID=53326 RepID=A0A016UIB0_9BILA|nr:hypothetical protein Y032_0040g306 [Ancylostoma ceylanicum]
MIDRFKNLTPTTGSLSECKRRLDETRSVTGVLCDKSTPEHFKSKVYRPVVCDAALYGAVLRRYQRSRATPPGHGIEDATLNGLRNLTASAIETSDSALAWLQYSDVEWQYIWRELFGNLADELANEPGKRTPSNVLPNTKSRKMYRQTNPVNCIAKQTP